MKVDGVGGGEYWDGYFGLPVNAYEGNEDCGSSFNVGAGYEGPEDEPKYELPPDWLEGACGLPLCWLNPEED